MVERVGAGGILMLKAIGVVVVVLRLEVVAVGIRKDLKRAQFRSRDGVPEVALEMEGKPEVERIHNLAPIRGGILARSMFRLGGIRIGIGIASSILRRIGCLNRLRF